VNLDVKAATAGVKALLVLVAVVVLPVLLIVIVMALREETLDDVLVTHSRWAARDHYSGGADAAARLVDREAFEKLVGRRPRIEPIVIGYTVTFGSPRDSVQVVVRTDSHANPESTRFDRRDPRRPVTGELRRWWLPNP